MKFWGVARPRNDSPKLEKVSVALYQDWGDSPAMKVEVPVNAGGVFTGEFTYRGPCRTPGSPRKGAPRSWCCWPRGGPARRSAGCKRRCPGSGDLLTPYNYDREKSLSQNYYGFLYLDRPIYHQDDTVKFWGVGGPPKKASRFSGSGR